MLVESRGGSGEWLISRCYRYTYCLFCSVIDEYEDEYINALKAEMGFMKGLHLMANL